MVLLGVFIAIVMELCGVSALPFAVGVYLPISVSTPIFVGGLVRWLTQKFDGSEKHAGDSAPGVLFSSGLIAGGAIAGIGIALASLNEGLLSGLDLSQKFPFAQSHLFAVLVFGSLAAVLFFVGIGKILKK